MYFRDGVWMLTVDDALFDQMGWIHRLGRHIRTSKYDSRVSILERIYDALETVSFCGIRGNGATSLAKKFVKFHESFHRIAMVTVSRNLNLQEIRNGIIQQIQPGWIDNCTLILSGFWWELLNNKDFQKIGIPSPSRSFNFVFASRNEDMCKMIGGSRIYHINFLEDEEAWDLFTEIAGTSVVDLNLHETARKIVDECDGFRIAVLTLASALKDKPVDVWEDTLQKLQDLNQTHVEKYLAEEILEKTLNQTKVSDKEKVLFRIRLSYDLLNDSEARSMFLICCLFPEDSNVPLEDLVLFGKGLQLFQNVYSMNQARDRVECIVHKLKESFFLLDGDEDDFVKVESMCRDFGVWMSSKLKHPYVVRCRNDMKSWRLLRQDYRNCRAVSLVCKTIKQHPVRLKCPNLHLLQFSCGSDSAPLPKRIFRGLENLQVLSLSIPSLSHPLTVLEQLRTLRVTESTLDNRYRKPRPRIGDLIGDEMENLEIFSFSTARLYDDFPKEIGLLYNLRYLKFNRERIKYIPEGVLSKLTKLEELYLPLDFISWGCKEEGGERINASLSELDSLQLTALEIGIAKGSILAETLVEKVTRFHVYIGSHVSPEYEFGICGKSKRSLEVFDVDANDFRVSWINALVWKSESLRLKQVRNLKSIITWQQKEDGNIEFPQWQKICISDCEELEYLVDGQIPGTFFSQLKSLKLFGLYNLKEIWHGFQFSNIKGSCFGDLSEIQILFCRKLKYVFSLSMATELRQLQSLRICFCDEMETIFYREQMQNDQKSTIFSLRSNSITKHLSGRGNKTKNIANQQQMQENTENEDEKDATKDAILFPWLKTMEFAKMDKLQIFYGGNHSILLPSLESLSIFQCHHLKAFSNGLIETPLLERILINGNWYWGTKDLNAILKNLKQQCNLFIEVAYIRFFLVVLYWSDIQKMIPSRYEYLY